MTTPIYTVYQMTNTINNKIYIGVHKTTNPNDSYLGSGNAIKSSIKKYGKEHFIKSILFEYDNSKDAYLKESQIVNLKFINQLNTYNMCVGGKGSQSGENHPMFGKYQNNNPNYGSKRTKKQKNNMRGNNNPMFGKIHSNETKQKISINSLRLKHSNETKQKISQCQKGKHNNLFKGYYVTPWGILESTYDINNDMINRSTINRWCKNPHKLIKKVNITKSSYLQSLKESPLGKTFKSIGFDFKPN